MDRGWGSKAIAKELGVARNTVRRYRRPATVMAGHQTRAPRRLTEDVVREAQTFYTGVAERIAMVVHVLLRQQGRVIGLRTVQRAVGRALTGRDVAATLERLRFDRGLPQRIYCDNGSEFVGAAMDLWAYTNKVILDFSRRGKPTDNATIESFNGRFRSECLNVHWFLSLEDAEGKIETWRQDYNEHHPHRALKRLSPNEYARQRMLAAANSPS